jgi:glycosyltransferase involved in cell wall biosynthesis
MSIPERADFEVFIVDDNSDSSEKAKIKDHFFNDNVIVIFNSDSGGAGKARNLALERASGKWVIFADADDFFSENMEGLLGDYFEAKEDIVYFGTSSIFLDTNQKAMRHERYMNLVHDFLRDSDNEDALRYYFTPPWSKMIRRELIEINNIRFEEILASNDMYFSLKSAYHARSITANSEILYIITLSHGSLTNSFSKKHFDAKFNAALRVNKYLCGINKKRYQQSILYFLVKSYKLGIKYTVYVIFQLMKYRSNIFIGLDKIFNYKKVMNERENAKYLINKAD